MLLLIFLFHFFLFCFGQIPHTAIEFHCKFLTRYVYWYFTSYCRYSIVSLFHRKFILKALYWQFSPKIQTWLHYPIIRKFPVTRSVLTYDTARYQGKLQYGQELVAHLLFRESCMCIYLLLSYTLCLYLKCSLNGCWYVNSFVSLVSLIYMNSLLIFAPYNLSSVIQLYIILIT